MWKKVIGKLRAEPVAVQGVIQAVVALVLGFGLITWTNEQTGLVLAFSAALLALVARQHVSPKSKGSAEKS
jgi:hypothetical protein